ncbi:hypothetical protein, partial [Neorickettsia sp. 179522]|uniref:hypothetical protein n=1 Tax=Neorickettsia sp. 179522 TaxID=1714371 RepID=UPI0018D233C6
NQQAAEAAGEQDQPPVEPEEEQNQQAAEAAGEQDQPPVEPEEEQNQQAAEAAGEQDQPPVEPEEEQNQQAAEAAEEQDQPPVEPEEEQNQHAAGAGGEQDQPPVEPEEEQNQQAAEAAEEQDQPPVEPEEEQNQQAAEAVEEQDQPPVEPEEEQNQHAAGAGGEQGQPLEGPEEEQNQHAARASGRRGRLKIRRATAAELWCAACVAHVLALVIIVVHATTRISGTGATVTKSWWCALYVLPAALLLFAVCTYCEFRKGERSIMAMMDEAVPGAQKGLRRADDTLFAFIVCCILLVGLGAVACFLDHTSNLSSTEKTLLAGIECAFLAAVLFIAILHCVRVPGSAENVVADGTRQSSGVPSGGLNPGTQLEEAGYAGAELQECRRQCA